jgi:Family of unknown function (DUF5681)
MSTNDEDAVGYGRPPKRTRFRPGQSGNPSGRPKRTPSFAAELQAELGEESTTGVTRQRALVRRLVAEAIGGNMRALRILIPILAKSDQADDDVETEQDQQLLEQFVSRQQRNPAPRAKSKESSNES